MCNNNNHLKQQFDVLWENMGESNSSVLLLEFIKNLLEFEKTIRINTENTATQFAYHVAIAHLAENNINESLNTVARMTDAKRVRIQDLTQALAETRQQLADKNESSKDFIQEEKTLKKQLENAESELEALNKLVQIKQSIAHQEADVQQLAKTLKEGKDPSALLQKLLDLRKPILSYYCCYHKANEAIAHELKVSQNVMNSLSEIDKKLKEIDADLAQYLNSKDKQT